MVGGPWWWWSAGRSGRHGEADRAARRHGGARPGGSTAPVTALAGYWSDDTSSSRWCPTIAGPRCRGRWPPGSWDWPISGARVTLAGPEDIVRVTTRAWLTFGARGRVGAEHRASARCSAVHDRGVGVRRLQDGLRRWPGLVSTRPRGRSPGPAAALRPVDGHGVALLHQCIGGRIGRDHRARPGRWTLLHLVDGQTVGSQGRGRHRGLAGRRHWAD